jgi:hypothetical protein
MNFSSRARHDQKSKQELLDYVAASTKKRKADERQIQTLKRKLDAETSRRRSLPRRFVLWRRLLQPRT